MLTLQQEEMREELRRELVLLLHLSREEYAEFPPEERVRDAFRDLAEVRCDLAGISKKYAALKLSVPPLLPSRRLRGVLAGCLQAAFGRSIAVSLRVPVELADTVEAARNLLEDVDEDDEAVVCFTDENAVGDPTIHLYELKERLDGATEEPVAMVFPLNHYDVLCLWKGSMNGVVWGPERQISEVYEALVGTPVSTTARTLRGVEDLMAALGF